MLGKSSGSTKLIDKSPKPAVVKDLPALKQNPLLRANILRAVESVIMLDERNGKRNWVSLDASGQLQSLPLTLYMQLGHGEWKAIQNDPQVTPTTGLQGVDEVEWIKFDILRGIQFEPVLDRDVLSIVRNPPAGNHATQYVLDRISPRKAYRVKEAAKSSWST